MTRPHYLADEVPKMAAELVRLRAALARIADRCADGVITLGQVEHIARSALAPRSERREGEHELGRCCYDKRPHTWARDCEDWTPCAPPAAPKEEAK